MLDTLSRGVARVAARLSDRSTPQRSATHSASPIGRHLKPLSANVVRLSAVVNDLRTRNWLAAVFQDAALKVSLQTGPAETWQLDIETRDGWLRLNVGLADVPLALGSAAITADRRIACEVASLLVAPVADSLAPVLVDVRIRRITRCHRPLLGFMFRINGRRVALTGADARLTAHAGALLATTQLQLTPWGPLKLAGRLRLMQRAWQRDFVATLATGDIVLLGPTPSRHTLFFGTGTSMQVEIEMDMNEGRVRASGTPVMANDEPPVPQGTGGRFEDLQLPVSFEIDTARVSLGELASMQPDYVVELDVPLNEATVRLVCHGQTIGHGQLVAVGAQVGVRITQMGLLPGGLAGGRT